MEPDHAARRFLRMTEIDSPTPSRSSGLKAWLIAASAIAVVTVPLTAFWAMFSVMSSTTTDNMAFVNTYVLVNAAIPLAIIVGLIGGWIAWYFRRSRLGWWISFLPVIPFVISTVMMGAWPA